MRVKLVRLVIKQTIFVAAMVCSRTLTTANVFMTAPMVTPLMSAVDKVCLLMTYDALYDLFGSVRSSRNDNL